MIVIDNWPNLGTADVYKVDNGKDDIVWVEDGHARVYVRTYGVDEMDASLYDLLVKDGLL